ncbi:TAXI family TRAP transporter solute-binding subunit [Lutispora saccharofermentans]|uniref:TAXI family TRAP transporter solute-binding subunit n=1 Tax=Lutispora saccharofermentans TaxID=3024236 RepID=A0ABT1NMC9_9FIRM|nr:TAXI family TRAP transporter solute-binding subunit [Lutispora saccharofermentans]MCQ1531076.1 TAXI family TRAP transporter solute-binding subunit [Lutispora saccharofermentans]
MKRKIAIVLALMLMFAVVFTACAPAKVNMILATGGTSGTYYPYGGAMAQIFNSKIENMNVTAQATGASVENCKLLGKNEAELAILQNDMLDYAYNGVEAFKDGKIESLRGIATLYPEIIQIVASVDSGITKVDDLKGKKVSVGAPGSGVEANARQILDATGLTYNDMNVSYLSFSESADAFKDKHIESFFVTSGIPNAAIQDIGAQNKISLVSLSDAAIKSLTEKYPFFVEYTIPAGTYNGQDSDVKTVAVMATLATNSQASEEVIYNITKALFENQPELAQAHAKGQELVLEKAVNGISIPFHPGAEKFFKEKGLIK